MVAGFFVCVCVMSLGSAESVSEPDGGTALGLGVVRWRCDGEQHIGPRGGWWVGGDLDGAQRDNCGAMHGPKLQVRKEAEL